MTFTSSGFLSEDLKTWIARARAEHPRWFSMAQELNAEAMKILFAALPSQSSSTELVGAVTYGRALQSYQGVVLLAERGMIADARTLARSCLESALTLGGIAKVEGFVDHMIFDYHKHRQSIANAVLNDHGSNEGLTDEHRDKLLQVIDTLKSDHRPNKQKRIVFEQLAKEIGLASIYNCLYRSISGDSAHPTLDSLTRHVKVDSAGEITHVVFQPTNTDLESTLSAAISSLLIAVEALGLIFGRDAFTKIATDYAAKWAVLEHPGNHVGPKDSASN